MGILACNFHFLNTFHNGWSSNRHLPGGKTGIKDRGQLQVFKWLHLSKSSHQHHPELSFPNKSDPFQESSRNWQNFSFHCHLSVVKDGKGNFYVTLKTWPVTSKSLDSKQNGNSCIPHPPKSFNNPLAYIAKVRIFITSNTSTHQTLTSWMSGQW